MSARPTRGSARRRIAGEAARRRRSEAEQEAATDATPETTPGTASARSGDVPGVSAPNDDGADTAAEVAPDTTDDRAAEPPTAARTSVPPRMVLRSYAPTRDTWWWFAPLALVTVLALVFVVVVGLRYLAERDDDAALAENRDQATTAAETAATEILSYDHRDLPADRDAAEQLMTESFRAEYAQLYNSPYCDVVGDPCDATGKFPNVIEQRKQQVDATVADAAAVECGDECDGAEVRVLLFINQATTSDGDQLAPTESTASFTMVRRDGEWLVDGITVPW